MSQVPHNHYCARVTTNPTASSPAPVDEGKKKGYFDDHATRMLLDLSPSDAVLHSGTYGNKELSISPIKFSSLQVTNYDRRLLPFMPLNHAFTCTDVLVVEVNEDMLSVPVDYSPMLSDSAEASWTSLLVNQTDAKDNMDIPAEGVYEPTPAWERPAGHTVQGIDVFKVQCHVNCFKESVTPVVGDSSAAPTLISKGFLDRLQFSKPKPHAGQKLKLLQLTGSAGCSEYVQLNLFFHSQIGPMCLKGVGAYVVKDMKANMLIGEDT